MKVVIRESASDDLAKIVRWIAQDNPESARIVATRILSAIEDRLILFPKMGRGSKARVNGWSLVFLM